MSFGNPQVKLAQGSSLQPTPTGPAPAQTGGGAEQLVATTGPNGYQLVNGTGPILSWTAPNDGNLHRAFIKAIKTIASAETGGAIQFVNGNGGTLNVYAGTGGAGNPFPTSSPGNPVIVLPGQTVTLSQVSALTAGASTLFAEIWAS